MAKLSLKQGTTSKSVLVFIQNSGSTTGAGLTGLVFNSASLIAYYCQPGVTGSTVISLATLASATAAYSSGGFKEIDATNMPGTYRLDIPNAALTGAADVVIMLSGAASMAPLPLEIELTGWDNQDAVHGGMSALPNTAVTTNASLLTSGTGTDQISVTSGRIDIGKALGTAVTLDSNNVLNVSAKYLAGTTLTARDIGASVLLSSGTGAGQLNFTSGVVNANATQWLGGTIPAVNVTGVPLVDAKYLLGTIFSTPATAGIPDANVKNINNVAAATPGASGGVLISGSNAGTTTLGALTVTGATTHTGNVSMAAGLTITQSTTNADAFSITGNGSGSGIKSTGGATGRGIHTLGGATSGAGMRLEAQGTASHGLHALGFDTGNGFNVAGGATGNGLNIIGGATSGIGVNVITTSGDGISVTPTAGNALTLTANGTSKHGAVITGGTAGTSDGIKAVAGTGGVDIRGSITGNLVGTVSTLTTYTGNTPQTGDSFARIGATGSGLTSLAASATALSTATWTSGRASNLDFLDVSVLSRLATSGYTVPPTAAAVATAVWTDTTAGDFTTATSPGKIIFTQLGGAFTTTSSSVFSTASLANGPTGGTAPTAAAIATAVWTDLTAGSDFATVASVGLLLVTNVNATISSRLASASYTTPPTVAQIARGVWIDTSAADFTVDTSPGKIIFSQLGGSFTTSSTSVFSVAALANAPTSGSAPTAAAIATAVWTDVTGSDFTASGSPGKILVAQLGGAFTTTSSSIFSTASLVNAPSSGSAPTVSQIATAVWTDALGSDFLTTGSIGRSLFTSGVVPGAAGGILIAGVNASATINITGSLSGSVGSVTSPVTIDGTQVMPTTGNSVNSVADCLNAARAQGFGKWTIVGLTLTLFAPDGVTAVRTFTIDSADAPTSRV